MFESRRVRGELTALWAPNAYGGARRPSQALRTFEASLLAIVIVLVNGYGALNPDGLDGFAQADLIHTGSVLGQIVWGGVYLIAVVALLARSRRAAFLLERSLPLIGLVAIIGASACWSSDPGLTAKRALGLLGTTAVAYWIATRFSLRDFLRIASIAIGVCVVLSLLAVVFVPSAGIMQTEYPGTWRGIFGHKNFAGEALSIGILTMLVTFKEAGRLRFVVAVALLLSAFFLFETQSATGALAAAAGIALFVLVELWHSPRLRPLAAILACVLAAAALFVALDWQAVFEGIGRDSTLTGRTDIWPAALRAIADRPLLGFGYSVFWVADGPVLKYIAANQGWQPYHAHNGFLQLTLDAGLLATGTFVLLFLGGIAAAVRFSLAGREPRTTWPLMVMVAFVVLNASDSLIASFNSFSWLVFCAAYLYAVGRQKADAAPVPPPGGGTNLALAAKRPAELVFWQERR